MEDIDLHHLSTLVAVIDCGTFDAAANQLHVTPSAISQRVKALESAVGCILLQRTKPIQPTQSGQELLSLARQIQLLSKEFSNRLHHETVAKLHIPLAVNADSLGTWMMPALAQAGEVATFEIYRDDEEYSAAMLRNGTVMAAVTSAAKPVQGCSSTRLGTMRYLAMATKDFTARWFPHGPTPQALSQAPVILFDRKDELQNRYLAQHIPDVTSVPVNYIPSTADYAKLLLSA